MFITYSKKENKMDFILMIYSDIARIIENLGNLNYLILGKAIFMAYYYIES